MKTEAVKILSLDQLGIGYGRGVRKKLLLPPVSAAAYDKELVAVIGRNGIGKSTLLRTITGLQPSFSGSVEISGKNISRYSRMELAKHVGYISTEIIRVNHMTVYDLVALGRFPHTNWIGRIDELSRSAIEDAINKSGMSQFAERDISELSDGERQRAMIARVLAQDASLMVLDEPLAFLDLPGKFEIIQLIRNLSDGSKTIIFSTHDLGLAIRNADRIWLMQNDGLIEGTPSELIDKGAFDKMFGASLPAYNQTESSSVRDYLKNFL